MLKIGDMIIANDEKLGLINTEMEVITLPEDISDEYKVHKGKYCIRARDRNGIVYILREDQYDVREHSKPKLDAHTSVSVLASPNLVNTSEIFQLKKRDSSTKKLFYVALETTENEITFFDDDNNRRVVSQNEIEKPNQTAIFDYVMDLQQQIHELRQYVRNTSKLLVDDIEENLHKCGI